MNAISLNPLKSVKTQSVARRLTLLSIALLAGVLLIVSLVIAVTAENRTRDRLVQSTGQQVQGIADTVDAMDSTARQLALRAYQPLRAQFAATWEIDAASGSLKSGELVLNGHFEWIDAFARSTGGFATVFMRRGDDFERISTSLKKENGERAMGTLLARTDPAYPLLLEGKPYTTRTFLFGIPYIAHSEAVRNEAGQVVGALRTGFDISAFQTTLFKLVEQTRFFQSGGTYVIDPGQSDADAVFVSHPSAAGRRVLDVFPQAQALLAQLRTAPDGAIFGLDSLYTANLQQPWTVMRQAKDGGWWVVADVSDRQAMASHWNTIAAFVGMLGLATVFIGLGLFWLIRQQVSRPLAELTAAVTSVAEGDLSHAFESRRNDEIGRLVREVEAMRQRFLSMMLDLRRSIDSINTAASEIASGNHDLSARTEQAASNLEETAASMEQITSTVRQSADAAGQANQLALSAAEVAVRGGKVVGQVVATMEEINHSSKKISDIIGVIDGIAFQTNILALNAAVEAARAGEQGRGFAVVAAEVRSLAQRSAQAAKEIKGLIGASVERVDSGARLVADAGATMSEIVGSVQRVCDIIGEITAAASEQSSGIGQVNTAVSQLDQMTQQNAALVEESAAAAESLKEQAVRLAQVVQVFRIDARAQEVAAAPPAPRLTAARAQPAAAAPPRRLVAAPARPRLVAAAGAAARSAPASPQPAAPARPARPAVGAGAEGEWESF